MMDSLLASYSSVRATFTKNENILADFVLENLEDVCQLTVKEIATATLTSPAAVIRFSKKLGYSGFKEFQIDIAKNIRDNTKTDYSIYEEISVKDSIETIITKVATANTDAIRNTAFIMKPDIIEEATKVLTRANCIHLFGIGGSYIVALDFQYKLVRINMQTSLHGDYHLQLVEASNINKDDVAVAISNSGKTEETYKALKLAKDRGAKTISITRSGRNPISDISDIRINTIDIEQQFRVGAISSRIAQLTVIDIIFMCLIKENYHRIPNYVKETGHIISSLKIQ